MVQIAGHSQGISRRAAMACFDFDPVKRRYHICFRYGGKPFKRSLPLEDDREAVRVCGVIQEAIKIQRLIKLQSPLEQTTIKAIHGHPNCAGSTSTPPGPTSTPWFSRGYDRSKLAPACATVCRAGVPEGKSMTS